MAKNEGLSALTPEELRKWEPALRAAERIGKDHRARAAEQDKKGGK
jgi:hypothetical protein